MRRILLSTDAAGGVWTYTVDLAQRLRVQGFAPVLAILGPRASEDQVDEAAGLEVIETGLDLDWTAESPIQLAAAAEGLRKLAMDCGAELVQLHSPALFGTKPWPLPVLVVLHSCVGTWWHAVRGGAAPADFLWRMRAVQQGLEFADAVVAPSHAMAAAARDVYGLMRNVDVVHNARAQVFDEVSTQRHGILAAGRIWDEGKNFAVLDQVARLAPDLPLAAAGPCEGANAARLDLQAMTWLGNLTATDMRHALQDARIFVSASRYEPFGLAVLEAALAGLPLVLADIPSFREIWGESAVFLPPDDAACWADALRHLHASPETCARYGAKARAHAARYQPCRLVSEMILQYEKLTYSRQVCA